MARVILVAGKGGVGKTTVASATGLACARHGHRTIILSFDLAHSLADSFDLGAELFHTKQGSPIRIAENLEILEIDLQVELERHWNDIYSYFARLLTGGGLDEVVAEEVAVMPGMEDLVALLRLNEIIRASSYDVVVLDAPPTGESLRFVTIYSTLDWYARKRLNTDRKLFQFLRPLTKVVPIPGLDIPDDVYFVALQQLFEGLDGIEELLRNSEVTTVRLVTTPDKMVMRETQRAFAYFSLYGMTCDTVVVNRLLPDNEAYFSEWSRLQAEHSRDIEMQFAPVPTTRIPLMHDEVVGLERLQALTEILYGTKDPATVFAKPSACEFETLPGGNYLMSVHLPFVPKEQIELSRRREDLVLRVGNFKRNILLPRTIAPLATGKTEMSGDVLKIYFSPRGVGELGARQ